eukprot:5582447-Prymnesium_polylepis.1
MSARAREHAGRQRRAARIAAAASEPGRPERAPGSKLRGRLRRLRAACVAARPNRASENARKVHREGEQYAYVAKAVKSTRARNLARRV